MAIDGAGFYQIAGNSYSSGAFTPSARLASAWLRDHRLAVTPLRVRGPDPVSDVDSLDCKLGKAALEVQPASVGGSLWMVIPHFLRGCGESVRTNVKSASAHAQRARSA